MKLGGPRGPDTIVWTLWLDYYTACWAQNTKINTVGEQGLHEKNDIEVYLVPIAVSMGPKSFWSPC